MPVADKPDPPATGCGAVLLAVGLILAWTLAWQGIRLAGLDEPSMGHIGHVGATLMLGPVAVVMILAGFHLLRRQRG
jgi:hypothetical protein